MPLSEIRVATEEKLSQIPGISKENARAIAAYYKTKKTGANTK
jgi:ERCC4-type nuclease